MLSTLSLLPLLRAAPLASSTASLIHATAELATNSAFLDPSIRSLSNQVLPIWFSHVFNRLVWVVVGLKSVTIATTVGNILVGRRAGGGSTTWYWVGLAGAVGHLMFVPWVAGPVGRIVNRRKGGEKGEKGGKGGEKGNGGDKGEVEGEGEGEGEVEATREMERWVSVHRVRMVVADLPGWLGCLMAVVTAGS
ncbi:hypothetical protein FQN50_007393 [Emmonsiellopsis sp. PD_5]|nr:hypothetical protein FQN50_007393 [Emmonsiellopsis sp. PD_5]